MASTTRLSQPLSPISPQCPQLQDPRLVPPSRVLALPSSSPLHCPPPAQLGDDFPTSDLQAQSNLTEDQTLPQSTAQASSFLCMTKGGGSSLLTANQSIVKSLPIHIRFFLADCPLILFPQQNSCTPEESTFRKGVCLQRDNRSGGFALSLLLLIPFPCPHSINLLY